MLERDALKAVQGEGPLELLVLASTYLALADQRTTDPFAVPNSDGHDPTAVFGMFVESGVPALAALAWTIGLLHPDRKIGVELQDRARSKLGPFDSKPSQFPGYQATSALLISDVYTESSQIAIEFRNGSEHDVSLVVMINHLRSGALSDAFLSPKGIDSVRGILRGTPEFRSGEIAEQPSTLHSVHSAVQRAIRLDSILVPRLTTDAWPASRAAAEWLLSLCGVDPMDHDDDETEPVDRSVIEGFLASTEGKRFAAPEVRNALELALTFSQMYTTTNPLIWSPAKVGGFLFDFLPNKVMAPPSELLSVPRVLAAFISYAHMQQGVAKKFTDQTCDALADMAEDFQDEVGSSGQESNWPSAIVRMDHHGQPVSDSSGMQIQEIRRRIENGGEIDLRDVEPLDHETRMGLLVAKFDAQRRQNAVSTVGGPAALAALTSEPLKLRQLDISGMPDEVASLVNAIGAVLDRACAHDRLGSELHAASRIMLRVVALSAPSLLQTRAAPEGLAYAVLWLVVRANLLDYGNSALTQREVSGYFGVTASPTARVMKMISALGYPSGISSEPLVGRIDLLVAARRQELINQREKANVDLPDFRG